MKLNGKTSGPNRKDLTTKARTETSSGAREVGAWVMQMGGRWVLALEGCGGWGQWFMSDLVNCADQRWIDFGQGWKVTNLIALVTEATALTIDRDHLECS